MKKQDFYFDLPQELIAQYPLPNRSDSRLLMYSRIDKRMEHSQIKRLEDYLHPGDLLVMNNSKVFPARLYGSKSSGGKVEILVERLVSELSFWAHIKASKALRPGAVIALDQGFSLTMQERQDDLFLCTSATEVLPLLQKIGHVPLPPYINRDDEQLDLDRYQTIYARDPGSVAAPTAGLHFDETLLDNLKAHGIDIEYLTLHVGAGTFRPVRSDNILEHKMHQELYEIPEALAGKIQEVKARGNRVIAVGTTSMRSLESVATYQGKVMPFRGETSIFIHPGYQFKVCDGLITNFHLPESTLVMLVSAFIGYDETKTVYQEAIAQKYRFFSYGDACLFL